MHPARLARRAAVGTAVTALAVTAVATPAAASTSTTPSGTRSLAAVLTADTSGLDRNGADYDILTKAVLTVLQAKPQSPVKVLTDGSVALTAFVPNDRAFERLAQDVTHARRLPSEQQAFTTVAGLGVDTVEAVLLYHVVPGATIDARTALRSDGAALTTALGPSITVDVEGRSCRIRLVDADTSDRDPRVVRFDINKGNRQIAHGIDRVLRPSDLP
ncbi:fasciclin domain-containing protein [Dactylosporangium aurantiacum]|uniref:Fasciclin domain-containing protein n=1 Tax=Dactylosporangium aurantiacum TaxID=35754 RepID=A0A9Q9I8E4_9ACTN|nr:fasciclin domain-containing protein [Dactylosporangium aurantiacum]MDG6107208.1 fasciclin domain-containing protein [Dactylosporangium aurantiacum]UWZ51257.1 fasciclin domain-containing protein [Dactylosporangium aurantiacum]